MANLLRLLSKKDKENLFDALYYMKMPEIKAICQKYSISAAGKKGIVLERIKHYLATGQVMLPSIIPTASKAKFGKKYPLAENTQILMGAYKNDLATRNFFKKIIGEHFHFTAYGQDWILKCWQAGKPPTYSQFAKFWQKEYLLRKKSEATPKKEWAYLNFMKKYQKKNPKARRKEIVVAWEKTRVEKARQATKILNNLLDRV